MLTVGSFKTRRKEGNMRKTNSVFALYALLPLLVMGDTSTRSLCSDMLMGFKACFSGELVPEQLINGWKWGDIIFAFTLDFSHVMIENQHICSIFAVAPPSTNSHRVFPSLNSKWGYLNDNDHPYLMFGINTERLNKKQSLSFVYCSKNSVMYPHLLNMLNLLEPSYEEAKEKQPSQCWDSKIYEKQSFHYARIDDQFIHWGTLNSEIDIVYRCYQQRCMGVMLIRRDRISPVDWNPDGRHRMDILDLHRFAYDFKWIPDHQIERFANEITGRLAQDKKIYTNDFGRCMAQCNDNNAFVRHLGFRYLGVVRTPSDQIFDVPWTKFSYYKSANNVVTLRSRVEERGSFNFEKFDSFVLNVEQMDEEAQVLLPNGLDIKPYLHSYPSENVLYEHIRFDKRYRIIVQPYIAYLYRDKSLIKILVCGNKNGPADHGWSLVRGYYCYEGMDWYYWPVSKAYSPLEN